MMSPTPAVRRFEPPSTLMHWTRLAPLLSATSRLDCIWIMVRPLSSQILSGVRFGGGFGLGLFRRLLGGLLLGLFLGLFCGLFLDLFCGRLRRLGHRRDQLRLVDLHGDRLCGSDAVDDRPGLQLRDRGAFLDAHDLADVELVRRVVRMVLLRKADDLAVEWGLTPPSDADHPRLFSLVRHYGAGEDALWHSYSLLNPAPVRRRGRAGAEAS